MLDARAGAGPALGALPAHVPNVWPFVVAGTSVATALLSMLYSFVTNKRWGEDQRLRT